MSGSYHYESDLEKALPGAEVRSTPAGFDVTLWCKECANPVIFHNRSKMPPEQFRKRMTQAGWQIGKRHNLHLCPAHQNKEPDPVNKPILMTSTSPTSVAVGVTDAAREARREVILILGDVFDVASGRYKEGESDTTVAACTNLSEDAVAKLREEFYGPLKMPSEVEAALGELRAVNKSLDDYKAHVSAELGKYANRTAAIDERITALIQKNGWKA